MRTRLTFISTAVLSTALLLSGCGSGSDSDTGSEDSAASGEAAASAASSISVEDPWIKAAEDGMTSAFGIVENTGQEDVTLVAVESPISDSIELHETADDGSGAMSMEEKDGGFPISAGGNLELAPGGDHIMFMSFDEPLLAGDSVDITLVFSDDSRLSYAASIRDFAGAEESYEDDAEAVHDHDDGDAS